MSMVKLLRRKFSMAMLAILLLFAVYIAVPLNGEQLVRDYSQVILASDSTIMRVFLNNDQQWCLPPQMKKDIPENLKTAVLAYEDQYFDYHPGVNPIALLRATYQNISRGEVVSGASTITMQLARMIKNKPRTLGNKLVEILLAIKLEIKMSKKEILNDYLAHAPYGSNIRGYLAASYRYFGKEPNTLTWSEAATLAVLPNAPGIIFPTKQDQRLENKRNRLLAKLYARGVLDKETYELSLLEEVPDKILPFPLASPHLTDRIHQNDQLPMVYTTIDQRLQYETTFFVKQYSSKMNQLGIRNACALIVENKSGNVVSYVGSQDYNDLSRHGRVDGIQANRSSGSILKPLLYALAIDEGLILPQSLIKDVPTYFSSFSPSNASEKFAGIVPASQALIHSLNVPAVRLLDAYGVTPFYNGLKAAGVSSLFRSPGGYGLPLILGGAEVNPWDMARLYSGLANGGSFGDIGFRQYKKNTAINTTLVSSGATYLVLEEMKELIRPGLEFYWKKYGSQRPIAWKTGTSYGHKDAWAVGVTPEWTIVVWVGNFNGESNKSISGMRSAGPLMFNLLNILPYDQKKKWFVPNPLDFTKTKICKKTGYYPGENCEETSVVKAPKHMKPLKICPYHKRYFVNPKTDYAVCSQCWDNNQITRNMLLYTPDVNYYLRKNGGLTAHGLAHNPDCHVGAERDILQIIYPLEKAKVFIPKDFDGAYQPLVSRLATQFPDREVFWYLDESFLGSTTHTASMPLQIRSGEHTLMVIDTEGNKDKVGFSVLRN